MQKIHSSNRGDATAVLVVILVVALLGALIFLAWQNFIKQDDTQQQTADTSQSKQDATSTSDDKTLVLSEWGVELPLTESTEYLSVQKEEDYYCVVVPESHLFDDESKTDLISAGCIARHALTDKVPDGPTELSDETYWDRYPTAGEYYEDGIVRIGDYAYTYTHRQSSEYLDGEAGAATANKTLETISVDTTPELFKGLRATES